MSIRRASRKITNFTPIDNAALTDGRLSFRARGVLAYLLSMPADWRPRAEEIARQSVEGRDAIQRAMRELEALGYLERRRVQNELGHWSNEAVIHERPGVDDELEPAAISHARPVPENPVGHSAPTGEPGRTQKNSLPSNKTNPPTETAAKREPRAIRPGSLVVSPNSQGRLDSLAQSCREKGLPARWDVLSPSKADAIAELLEIHGVPALVEHALKMHSPGTPTRWAGGLLNGWLAMPLPRRATAPAAKCDRCDGLGWHGADYDIPCPICRPTVHRARAAAVA
jgi:hypothetical protein